MQKINTKSVSFKIVLYSTICVMVVGIISNLYIYVYLQKKIVEKADAIDSLYLTTLQNQINLRLSDAYDLGVACANDGTVVSAMSAVNFSYSSSKRALINAQETLNTYVRASSIYPYIMKLVVFGSEIQVQAHTVYTGRIGDATTVMQSRFFRENIIWRYAYSDSIDPYAGDSIAILIPVSRVKSEIFLYMELDPKILTDVLLPYSPANKIFVSLDSTIISPSPLGIPPEKLRGLAGGDITELPDGKSYKASLRPLSSPGFYIYNLIDVKTLSLDNQKMIYTLLVVLISVLFVSVGILIIMSSSITRPIKRLIAHIKRISANDFSYDHSIEQSGDEIGEIGRVVNEMAMSINSLIQQNDNMHEQRRQIEIELLQSQVNPHFVYNTLDSIHWMAVIQKSPGIERITKALGNLLRNIAKGTQDKITLEEEIALLLDYVDIQLIRYMEAFQFVNNVPRELYSSRIVKLTLQPLVENAIFHGIEPTGEFGTITLGGSEEEGDLLLFVEDDGMGIDEERLTSLLTGHQNKSRGSLNGIGLANVHNRLRMLYGSRYGLHVESVLGSFTRVTLRIPKEE